MRRRIKIWADNGQLEDVSEARFISKKSLEKCCVLYDDALWEKYLEASREYELARLNVIRACIEEPLTEEELLLVKRNEEARKRSSEIDTAEMPEEVLNSLLENERTA